MKKIILLATIAFVAIGCTGHQESDRPMNCTVTLPEMISASCEALTRTEVNTSLQTLWSTSDRISLFPGADCNIEYKLYRGTKSAEGEFQRVTTETKASGLRLDDCYAVYPYAEEIKVSTGGEISLNFPSAQKYVRNSFAAGSNVMVATADNLGGGSLKFSNVGGYVKIMLYGTNATVKSCSFAGNKGEKIAGAAVVTLSKEGVPELAIAEDGESSVTLDCGMGAAIGGTEESATAFWFVLPPMEFAEGYTITVIDNNNVTFTKKITTALTVEQNKVHTAVAIKTRLSGDGLEIIDNKVRFYLSVSADNQRAKAGLPACNWAQSNVIVNNKVYDIMFDEEEIPYIDVELNSANSYAAALVTSSSADCYGDTPYVGIKLSHSQFYHKAKNFVTAFPMYASYSVNLGNHLVFNDAFALIHLKLKGKAKIASVKVENISGGILAGPATINRNSGSINLSRGMSFVALNCTNNGNFVQLKSSEVTDFYVMTAPKSCSEGLKVTICDSEHLAMFKTLSIKELEVGKVYTFEEQYTPEKDMIYYEGFDNFVWGGDVVKGSVGRGYSPDDTVIGMTTCADRTGYEDALTEVSYNNPGTCFIQSNTWDEVSGYTIDTSHQVTDSYIKSRNLGGTQYMFRTQEHPGYIGVGATSTSRGIFSSTMMRKMTGIGTAKVTVRFAMQPGFTGPMIVAIAYGGVIKEAVLNGKPLSLTTSNLTYASTQSNLTIAPSQLNIATSETSSKPWNTLELIVDGVTDGSRLYMADSSFSNGTHGIYIDSIESYQVSEGWQKGPNTLRVMLWNIQNGMWADQHNGYDNFVKWVRKYDPDVCIWCESETIYNDKANTSMTESARYLPASWPTLCQYYGHSYAKTGGNRDNYSQTVTSKYPITTLNEIKGPSSKPVSHGAGHFVIVVNGMKINIVSLHMWPQAYKYGVNGTTNREVSAANREGDYYRQYEMQYIVDNTINHSSYANEELWLFGGDTNSRSRKDAWYYSYASDDPIYITHDVVLNQTNLKDVIADYYPSNYFFTSTSGNSRIDMLYVSPAMFDRIENSVMLMDSWSNSLPIHDLCKNWSSNKFRDPSDHRPVLVDFNME